MADHVIVTTDASGEYVLPPVDITEYLNNYWIAYTFPASQQKITASSVFEVKFNRPIDLTQLTNDNFKIERVLTADPATVLEITNPFVTINSTTDYDSISRTLTLQLNDNLPQLSVYVFTIQDLVDTTTAVQVDDHVVVFGTAVIADSIDVPDTLDVDQIIIEDYTLISPPAPSGYSDSRVICSIPNGTLNVASSTSSFTLAFTAVITTSNITVTEEDLETGNAVILTPTITQNGTTFLATVTLDNQGTAEAPIYIRENCIYIVDAIYSIFEFTGTLDPFFVPLTAFKPFTNAAVTDPIGWARIVWEFSNEIRARLGVHTTYETSKAEELKQFTKYFILAFLEGSSTNDSFMLGELQITSGIKNDIDYKGMADMWESRLFGRHNVIRSVDVFGPRADTFARVAPGERKHLERNYGVFDRRLPY